MRLSRRLVLSSLALAAPMILWAFSVGPPAARTNVPGEGNCTACHQGTALNGGPGNLSITASSMTYTAGTPVTITLTINDTDGRTRFGFQGAARAASDSTNKTQAGSFRPGSSMRVRCLGTDLANPTQAPNREGDACPSAQPLEYIEQGAASESNTFTFDWMPTASTSGNVIIYGIGNAANGNGANSGDRIYAATLQLTPAAGGTRPTINANGAVTAVNWGGSPTIASGTWVEIYGTNLAASTADWGSTIGSGTAPTELNGVSVRFGDTPAFLSFVSATQVNAQVPDGVGAGATTLTVRNANGTSDNYTIQAAAASPSFLAPPNAPFRVGTRQFVAALFPDSTSGGPFVGPTSMGTNFRSARAGDRIILYAIGMGAVSPAQQAGRVVTASNALTSFSLQFGDATVTTEYAGLAPNTVGLYQINATVPNLPAGEYEIRGMVNGTPIASGLFINLR
jgi:uncharacterized protein (TIGR03437 family)